MKSFVYIIALAVFLGSLAVQGYGPNKHRKKIAGPPFHNGPPHRPHHGPPHRPPQHGFGPHRAPPNQKGHWDDSPIWDDGSDSRDSSGDTGNSDSYDSYGSFSRKKDRPGPGSFDSSYEDSDDWSDHHRTKHPCTKKPTTTTRRPITRTKPITPKPTTPRPTTPKPTTPRPTTPRPTTPRPTTPRPKTPRPTTPRPTTPRPTTPRPTTPKPTTPKPTTPKPIPETTPTLPETTTTNGGLTTMSPERAKCVKSCLSTNEYNPVCGSDGQTYGNEGKLLCAKSCGVNVTLRRRSACPPPVPDDGGLTTGTLPPTTTATTPNLGRTTPLSDFTKCMRLCRITPSFSPVCGSDLVTYMNMDRLKCAQSCGEVVHVLCEKPCAACGFNPVTATSRPTTTTLRPITTPQIGQTTADPGLQECLKTCPVTSEYNPVCGTDHVTYSNPSRLVCAQMCGAGVAVSRIGPCGLRTTTSTTTEAPTTTLSPEILSCIKRCPVTSEYEPVCGTDNHTYSNYGNLYCARFCGVDVDVKHKKRCVDEFDLDIDGTTQDINGSKDRLTSPITTSTLMPPTTPTSKVTTDAGPNSSSTLGFTLPKDVLEDIFGTTQAPITKPTNPDEDEDLDLDPRFNEAKHSEESS